MCSPGVLNRVVSLIPCVSSRVYSVAPKMPEVTAPSPAGAL